MYNALTENIISSQYEYLNYKFFEDNYVDKDDKRSYLFDLLLGIDNVEEKKQQKIIDSLKSNQRSTKIKNTKYEDAVKRFLDKLKEAKILVLESGLAEKRDFIDLSGTEQILLLDNIIVKNEPRTPETAHDADEKKSMLTQTLYQKQVQLNNILRAKREYEKYWEQISSLEDGLKPVEYLQEHIEELGVTVWSRQILDSLQNSLSTLRERGNKAQKDFVSDNQIQLLRKEITDVERQMQNLDNIKITPIQNSERYYVLGRLKEFVEALKNLHDEIPTEKPRQIDEVQDGQIRKQAEKIIEAIKARRTTVVGAELNPAIQHYFDKFKFLENFAGSKTRYNRDHERLEIGKDAILNYTNVGSQSNYMFLHICFFLGLHRFLTNNPSQYVGQFLFIDQPSIPYYESSENTKSTDKLKLMDAFKVINAFMQEMADENEEFQIILIEHAEESYWTGENALSHFVTKANFEGDNALVPLHIIEKHKNEAEN